MVLVVSSEEIIILYRAKTSVMQLCMKVVYIITPLPSPKPFQIRWRC